MKHEDISLPNGFAEVIIEMDDKNHPITAAFKLGQLYGPFYHKFEKEEVKMENEHYDESWFYDRLEAIEDSLLPIANKLCDDRVGHALLQMGALLAEIKACKELLEDRAEERIGQEEVQQETCEEGIQRRKKIFEERQVEQEKNSNRHC